MIALLSAPAAAPEVPAGVELVRVNSGYEAAAEMLAAPASALVADLGRITPGHLPLLDLARALDLPVVAFGTIMATLSADHLRMVRLVSPPAVGPALREVLHVGDPEPTPEPAEAEPAPAEDEPEQEPSARPAVTVPEAGAPPPADALTQAELDALLGDAS